MTLHFTISMNSSKLTLCEGSTYTRGAKLGVKEYKREWKVTLSFTHDATKMSLYLRNMGQEEEEEEMRYRDSPRCDVVGQPAAI